MKLQHNLIYGGRPFGASGCFMPGLQARRPLSGSPKLPGFFLSPIVRRVPDADGLAFGT
ncbi:MAG TPA: hypothetical protein VGR14_16835 [Verrucomicrobiae bacterium]|nr:hypothetical protein [Verrucomicrobiae bacterium]